MPNSLTLAREHKIFAVKENTEGELEFPTNADLVIPAGYGRMHQVPGYSDSEEVVDSRSLLDQFEDGLGAGEWSIPMYRRPAGAGSKPQGAALYEGLFGTETVNAGVSVVYSLAKKIPTYSIWMKYGPTVLFAKGCTVNRGRFPVQRRGAVKDEFSGGLMWMGYCGTDALNGAIDGTVTPVTQIVVGDAKKYAVGGRIQIGTDDNSNVGYTITAVDTGTDTLTISPGCDTAQDDGATVAPYLPAGTKVGSPTESKHTTVSFDDGATGSKVKTTAVEIVNNVQYQEEEITADNYPSSFVVDSREVSMGGTLLFRRDDVHYFADGHAGNTVDVKVSYGSGGGNLSTFDLDKVRLTVPRVTPTAPTVELAMDGTALGTNGEDEAKLTFA